MHSLVIETDFERLCTRFQAAVDESLFSQLFEQRSQDPRLKICKGLEYYFTQNPDTARKKKTAKIIQAFNKKIVQESKKELQKQQKRLEVAKEKIEKKKTKTNELELKRAEKKVTSLEWKIKRHEEQGVGSYHSRIFPFYFASLLVSDSGQNWIRPFRFHCRPAGKSPSFDREYPSLYKAKKESLTLSYFNRIKNNTNFEVNSLWEPLFGAQHAVLIYHRFYENVPKHIREDRKLKKGEKKENVVLGFEQSEHDFLLAPCLYDRWQSKGETLDSFAIITQPAPKEIQQEGYHRCPVFLKEEALSQWLNPKGLSNEQLHELLDDSVQTKYQLIA